jgi:hypothetical protein
MNQEIRNKLRNVVTQCRKLLENSVSQELEGKYGIFAKKDQVTADPNAAMTHLTEEEQAARKDILDHFGHIKARGFKPKDALDQLVREIAFTHLNRLCAYKMMEAREVYVGGQKFREAVSRGINSNGVKFYLADHPEEERLFNTGQQDVAYRRFLDWLGGLLSDEIGVLFNPNDPANRLYPRQATLDEVLELLNGGGIRPDEIALKTEWPNIWVQDETIGWIYQYFTPKEMREKARSESRAPRNSNELGFRNQFFTPRYVVEYLTDNTLGRIWYEMRKGNTELKDNCRYMVRRPTEVFLKDGEQSPKDAAEGRDDLSQEELLKQPLRILHRAKKDPREVKVLDPACGSGHFLLYCFDLFLTIYEEAYADTDLGPALKQDYETVEDLRRDVPRLILAHNLHGIDIDQRASQIAALALWLRCQRAYQEMGLKKERPKITRSNFVCAEPMPGEEQMLKEFVSQLEPKLLGQVVEVVFDKMKIAGEAGSLLRIEEEIRDAVAAAKKQWVRETTQATDRKGQPLLFTQTAMDLLAGKPEQPSLFDLSDITDDQFFGQAEAKVLDTLRQYAEKAQNGQRLQRRLFTDDAVRGFAFIDLCQRRYDVVLMNPPFGMVSKNAKTYVEDSYPNSKGDILTHFVERALQLCSPASFVAAISNRSCFYNGRLTPFRKAVLGKMCNLVCMADFGEGVLDATVETAAYVLNRNSQRYGNSAFFRALISQKKEETLLHSITSLATGVIDDTTFLTNTRSFDNIHNSPYTYWVPQRTISHLHAFPPLEGNIATVRVGLQTGEDARFLRMIWEVPAETIGTLLKPHNTGAENYVASLRYTFRNGKRWAFYSKTDYACPWLSPLTMVVDWQDDGDKLKDHIRSRGYSPSKWVQSEDKYFAPGFSYMVRSTRLVPFIVPPGVIPMAVRSQVYPENGSEIKALGICASRIGSAIARFSGGAFARPMFQASMVQNISTLPLSQETEMQLEKVINDSINMTRELLSQFEPWQEFALPAFLVNSKRQEIMWQLNTLVGDDVERRIADDSGLAVDQTTELCRDLDEAILIRSQKAGLGSSDVEDCEDETEDGDNSQPILDFSDRAVAEGFVSYLIGIAFGRWDIRFALDKTLLPKLHGVLDPLPVCPPGMLVGTDGLPATRNNIASDEWLRARPNASYMAEPAPVILRTITSEEYPFEIQWNGVIPDDDSSNIDIVRLAEKAFEKLQAADGLQSNLERLCNVLGIKELRDYFRRSGKGGFWDDHVNRYKAKRGRKAPVYWLLQSSKRNYALWLYFHRLDKDLLFKMLVNFVEPKIRLETSQLETLRLLSQEAASGESGKKQKQYAKDIEEQEDFLSELRDFEDKLRRAASLYLEPDLNDGVVLNIAPLWELVPWKEAKKNWDDLLAGKFEWSSIGKQLRQKGLVK